MIKLNYSTKNGSQISAPEFGLLLDLAEAVQVVVDPGAGAVVEHAVVEAARAAEAVGHRGRRGRGVVRVLGGLLLRNDGMDVK